MGCENRYIVGAVFHGDQPRIVRIDDFMLEAVPMGPTLFIQNQDQPGVVGSVGTVLGQGGINISRMQLALIPERSLAAMLVNIDRAPEEAVMKQLRNLPHMISAQLVELGS
jgi:D-3-phosphoglycerate dehydrogenase